jgi:DNA primase
VAIVESRRPCYNGGMAGLISPEIVEQVRQSVDIVDVIGGYVPLKRAGSKFKALSPFNKEKTPSFFVDPARQIFKCFSSGHGGDVFKFLMVHDHMTFPEAVRRLAQRAGVVIPESGPADPEARGRREELLALHAAVAAWWHKLLMSDPNAEPARAYLKSREMDSALAQEFGLGYAPDGWDTTLTWARKAGYSAEALEASRLVAVSEASGKRFDFFRGRLMIPIHDESGQVVAFSGRLLDPNAKAQKYVNSPETPIFVKSRILFGLHRAKRPIIEADSAILCEGQIDLMRCWQKGVTNVVAPQGTAFTDEQARKLKRLAKEVVICFDADNAGQNAAQRAIDVLLKEDIQIRLARMPEGEDPDSLLRKNPVEVFQALIVEAKDYTRHLLDVACVQEDIASPRGRGQVAQKMAQVIAHIPNAVQRETFLLEVARRLQMTRNVVDEEVRKAEAQQKRTPSYEPAGHDASPAQAAAEQLPPLRPDKLVEALLAILLLQPGLVAEVTRKLNAAWLEGLEGVPLLLHLLDTHAHDGWEDASQFLDQCDERSKDYLAGLLVTSSPAEPADISHLGETGLRYERYRAAIGSAEKSPAEMAASFVQLAEARWAERRFKFLTLESKSKDVPMAEQVAFVVELETLRKKYPFLKSISL